MSKVIQNELVTQRQTLGAAKTAPLFYNCWNRNAICSFVLVDNSRWFGVFGKHSKHFPIYGASYDNLMLFNVTTGVGYGITEESLPNLRFVWEMGSLRVFFEGTVDVYDQKSPPRETVPLKLDFSFRAVPLPEDKVFLKRIIPIASRWVPGAVFRNHLLVDDTSSYSFVDLGGKCRAVESLSLKGHFENGSSSLINHRAWTIPYRYIGLLRDENRDISFYYRWQIKPLPAKSLFGKSVAMILKNIHKETTVLYSGRDARVMPSNVRGLPETIDKSNELFSIPCRLGEFNFKRGFLKVQGQGADQRYWYGILEDFGG